MPAAFVAVRKFARAALLRGAGLFAALLFAAGFVGGVAGEGLGAGNVAHAQVPNAPQGISGSVGPGTFVIYWSAATVPNNAPAVTAYVVHGGPIGSIVPILTLSGDARAATIIGLPGGQLYAAWVVAQNSSGNSSNSGFYSGTPSAATAPSAPSASGAPTPTGVSPARVTLSWSAPAANGSPITAYLLSYGGTVSETLPASQTATVIGVSLGVAYRFTLRAANAIGNSPAAVVAASIAPPVTAPSAVQNFDVFSGDRLFVVTWDPPSDWGNSQLSAYIVSMGILNNFDVYTVANAAITLTTHSYHADGVLNPSDTYKIQVVPRSQAGLTGPMVELVRAPGQSPDAPNVTTSAPASGTQLSVSWSAANNNSWNTAATAYAVRLGAVNATLGSGTTATIIGNLQGNTAYTLSVWGISPIGAGAARVITATTAISPAPGEPRNFTLVSRDARTGLVLAWDEPSSWAGSSLSVYRLQFRLESGSWDTHETTDTRHTITTYLDSSLGPWVGAASQVEFRILARSHAGSNSQLVNLDVPQEVVSSPNAPIVTATALAGGTQISVGWSPANNSGHNTGATAYALRLGAVSVEIASATTATIIGGLQGNTAYTLSVWGISPIGAGAARVLTVTTATPPSGAAPDAPTLNAAATPTGETPAQITLGWSAPNNGGSAITAYFLSYGTVSANLPASATASVVSVSFDVAYSFTLRAANAVGASPAAVVSARVFSAIGYPGPARNLRITRIFNNGLGFDFAWDPPEHWGGGGVGTYNLRYKAPGVAGNGSLVDTDEEETTTRSASFPDVPFTYGQTLLFYIWTRNVQSYWTGPSHTLTVVPSAPPAATAPSVSFATVTALASGTEISVSLSVDDGGSALTGLTLLYGGTAALSLSPTTRAAVIASLSANTAYTLSIVAVNAVGAATAVATATTPAAAPPPSGAVPSAPIVHVIWNNGVGLYYMYVQPPEDDGGAPISVIVASFSDSNSAFNPGGAPYTWRIAVSANTDYPIQIQDFYPYIYLSEGETALTLWAENANGAGATAVYSPISRNDGPPTAPRNVRANAASGEITVSWRVPWYMGVGSGATFFDNYFIDYGTATLTVSVVANVRDEGRNVGAFEQTVVITTDTSAPRGISVWTNNNSDDSPVAAVMAAAFVPPPAAPSVSFATVTALASGTEISVSLSVDDGGSSLTGLTLLYGGTAALTLSPTTRAAVIASLNITTAYTLSVIAVNAVGAATAVATATTPAAAATNPSAPRNFSVASGDVRLGLVLSWDEPASWGGSTLGVYSVGINIYSEGWENYETTDTRLTIANYSGSGLANWRPGPANLRILARSQAGLNSGYVNLTSPAFVVSPDMPNVAATALASGTEISVNWSRRNNDSNNTAATAYALRLGTVNATLASATTLTVVGNLQGNTGYTLSVWGISPAGAGAVRVLNLTTAPLPSAPDAPTVNVATTPTGEAAATVTLSWSAPANGGSAITGYFLSYGTVSATLPASQTATAIGVSLGVAYVFTLQAANAIGASPAAVVNASIAAAFTQPHPPQNFVVVTGNLSFVISWDEPADWGGSTLSIYRFAWRDTNDNTQVHEVTDNKVTLSTRLDPNSGNNVPLVAGNGYYIFIGARSQANLDSSFTRFPAAGFLTAVALSAPSVSFATVTALTSGTEISISLLVDDGGGGLSGLTLLYGGTEARSLPPTTRQAVIGALSKNAAYTLSIIAVNSEGAATAVATATTPATAPSAPALAAAATPAGATPAQVTLSWSAPADNGGAAITAYFLSYGTVSATLAASATATVVSVLFDVSYVFTLQAANSVGASPAAVASASIAPPSAPSAPANFNAAATPAGATPAQVTLGWSAPADNGGSAITAYFLSYGTVSATLPASATATVVSVLFDVPYVFTLQAANSVGASPAAVASASIAPPSAPSAPANFNAAATPAGQTPAQVTLSWSAPADNGGSAITAYFLSYGTVSATLPASATATVVSVLFDVSYVFTLQAASSVGASPAAVASASIAPPSAPSAPANFNAAATPAGQTLAQVTLSWSAPANNGGSAITAYILTYGTVSANLQASQSATVIDVSLGVAYSFTLRAANSVGASPAAVASASIAAAPAVGQDAAPDAVVLQAAAGAFSRAFSTPINDRLLAIDGGGNAASAGFMGANFAGAGGAERGIAQLLKRHGNAIANGGNFDSAALRNGSFVMPLGNGGGNAGAGAMGLAKNDILSDLAGIVDRLTDWLGKAGGGAGNMLNNAAVWGGASYRGVENNKNADKWEGNSASYYLGIDSAVGEANENGGVLAGVVFAHNRFKSDYKLANNGGEGEYNVAANSAHPYLLWRSANGKNRAWGSFGFGVGNVERKGAAGDASDRSAKVGGGSAGFRGAVWQRKGVAIDAQADWSFANINIDGGAAARANNLRALLEARGSVAMAGGGFGSPFAQLGYVRQADDANNGAGWEAAAGWRWRGAGGWSGELRGGAADISNGNKEWSAAGVLRKAAANSKGFSMSLRPQYGASGARINGGGDFWSMPVAKESANPRLGINAKLGYGFTAANALWKPYLSANTAAGASAAYGAGAAWQNLLQSNLALRAAVQAQRQEQATALQLRFTATY